MRKGITVPEAREDSAFAGRMIRPRPVIYGISDSVRGNLIVELRPFSKGGRHGSETFRHYWEKGGRSRRVYSAAMRPTGLPRLHLISASRS